MLALEKAQRKCIRFVQGISDTTRSDVALSLIGCRLIESEIDYRKLSFFGQLCNLDTDYLVKRIFVDRLIRYNEMPFRKKGFFPDIYRLLRKYRISHYFYDYMNTGVFPSKYKWKSIVRRSVREFEISQRQKVMERDPVFAPYLDNIVDVLTPVPIWLLCKECPSSLVDCKNAVKMLSRLFSHEFTQICNHCDTLFVNYAVHAVFDCVKNEQLRQDLWHNVYSMFGHDTYMSLIRLDPKSQIAHLCFGLCQVLKCDTKRELCLKLVVNTFSRMLC